MVLQLGRDDRSAAQGVTVRELHEFRSRRGQPRQRTQLQVQHFGRTGLREIGVGAGVERRIPRIGEGGDGDDRNVRGHARTSQLTEYGPAVDSRHREIEHNRVGPELERFVDADAAVGGGEHRPAFGAQELRVHLARIEVVLDDDYAVRFLESASDCHVYAVDCPATCRDELLQRCCQHLLGRARGRIRYNAMEDFKEFFDGTPHAPDCSRMLDRAGLQRHRSGAPGAQQPPPQQPPAPPQQSQPASGRQTAPPREGQPPGGGRGEQPPAAQAKPVVPVATNSVNAHPDTYVGQTVTMTAAVDQILSKSAFSVDQQRVEGAPAPKGPTDVLVLVPTLQSPVDPKTYVTVMGELVKFDPAEVAKKAKDYKLDLPAEVAAKIQRTADGHRDLGDHRKVRRSGQAPPPPMTADEETLSKVMKQLPPALAALRAAVDANKAEDATKNAMVLRQGFTDTEAFWKPKKAEPTQWAHDAKAKVESIQASIAAGKWDEGEKRDRHGAAGLRHLPQHVSRALRRRVVSNQE